MSTQILEASQTADPVQSNSMLARFKRWRQLCRIILLLDYYTHRLAYASLNLKGKTRFLFIYWRFFRCSKPKSDRKNTLLPLYEARLNLVTGMTVRTVQVQPCGTSTTFGPCVISTMLGETMSREDLNIKQHVRELCIIHERHLTTLCASVRPAMPTVCYNNNENT